MKQWEIWTCDFAEAGPHPAVIVSDPDRVARAPLVNVLIGSSQRATRPARENEVVLNGADGLDWETVVKCDLMYLVEKAVSARRGGAPWSDASMLVSDSHWSEGA
jgi:mRNA-degrading endonuclease toxin of MazEF toxin-antitoxin module